MLESWIQGLIDSAFEEQNTPELLNSKSDKEFNMTKYNNKTIFKRTDRKNGWYMRYYHNGKQHKICGKTQKEVVNKFKELKKNNFKLITSKTNKIVNDITLEQWYKNYIELYKINKVTETTLKTNEYDFKKVKKLHKYKLKEINQFMLQNAINEIPYKSTSNRVYILLNALFEKAFINDLIPKNVMKLVEKPKYKAKEKIALTKDEEQKFINACKNHKYGNYYLICLYQGLRKGECRALRVNDIDFKNMTLRIDESLNTHTNRTNTKNEQSNRIMPIFEKSIEILKSQIKGKTKNDLIFDIGINRVDKALKEILEMTDIPKISTHILRHTFITRCQEVNIPLYVVQNWVGHEKGSVVTTKIYTHLNEETNKKYTDLMNKRKN